MRRINKIAEGKDVRRYQPLKGYSVLTYEKKPEENQHFVVPWELDHKDEKKKLVF